MTDHSDLLRRLNRANPYPDQVELPVSLADSRTALALLTAGESLMDTQTRPEPASRERTVWRGPAIAAVTAVMVLIVGGAIWALSAGTSDEVASGAVFDFAEDDLCEWFGEAAITEIVYEVYRTAGHEVPPGPLTAEDEQEPMQCVWLWDNPNGLETKVQLGVVLPGERSGYPQIYDQEPEDFAAHESMSDGVRVGNLPKTLLPGYILGVSVDMVVDGHEEVLWFVHWSPGFDLGHPEDLTQLHEVGLAIADEMLKRMGWVDG